jgi:dipeptidase
VYSISNCLTINDHWDIASRNLVDFAMQKGFSKSAQDFNFANSYSDFLFTNFGKGRKRRETTYCVLEEQRGEVTIESMMRTLRHHEDENFDPQSSITDVDVCMHAGFGPIRVSQSTASMVVYLDKDNTLIFATGTSAPCTSIFKPMWMDAFSLADASALGPTPASTFDSESLYWTHERLHRATLLNYPERIKAYAAERDEMESRFTQAALGLNRASAKQRADFTAQCFRESIAAEAEWLKRVEKIPAHKKFLSTIAWNGFNKKAAMKV